MEATVSYFLCYKNTSIQIKRLWNKRLYTSLVYVIFQKILQLIIWKKTGL